MENIKKFLERNPSIKEIHFDEKGGWLYSKAPNHIVVKTLTREEILTKQKEAKEQKSDTKQKEAKEQND